jgi:tripartite-type tricarboxylate transporter receptor subunit TctC
MSKKAGVSRFVGTCAAFLSGGLFFNSHAVADPIGDFYKDKRISIVVSAATGGTYGLYGRLVADHITKYLPGAPKAVVQFMPGAAGIVATNYMYNIAPKDGTYAGMLFKDMPMAQVAQPDAVKYDARNFNWIGSVNQYYAVVMVWAASGIDSLEAARQKELIMASSGRGHHGSVLSLLMNELLGTRIRMVTGYNNAGAQLLAMERGEVHSRVGSWESIKTGQASWLAEKKINLIAQAGISKAPELSHVPLILDLIKNPTDRAVAELVDSGSIIGWSLSMPPGVSREMIAAWRTAFQKMTKDEDFRNTAKKLNADIDPRSGEEIETVINRVLAASPEVLERTRALVKSAN